MCDAWTEEFERKFESGQVDIDKRLAGSGVALFRSLPRDAVRSVLLYTDLHAGNVLAARREPWLVVDPKPYVGDPTYDVLQHLINCRGRLTNDPVGLAASFAARLDLDPRRLLLWLFARCVQESPDTPWLADVARLVRNKMVEKGEAVDGW